MSSDVCVVLGGVGIVKGSIRQAGPAMVDICRELNPYLVRDRFVEDAPFSLLNGIIRFGNKLDPYASVGPIDRQHRELPFSVEVDMNPLKRAEIERVKSEFLRALIPALLAIAIRYELPNVGLRTYIETQGIQAEEP